MDITRTDNIDGTIILKLDGELDAFACNQIRSSIEYITNASSNDDVILDLSDVSFIDSSGIGLIVFLFKGLNRAGRSLKITNIHGQPQELISMLHIDEAIPVKQQGVSDFSVIEADQLLLEFANILLRLHTQ